MRTILACVALLALTFGCALDPTPTVKALEEARAQHARLADAFAVVVGKATGWTAEQTTSVLADIATSKATVNDLVGGAIKWAETVGSIDWKQVLEAVRSKTAGAPK